jgi:diguanylate cyclase (GGDEF)-like protein
MAQHVSWRSTYLLGVALLLPIGTLVLVCYYFTRMSPFAPEMLHSPWAFSIIAVAGGLSALMAALLALFASAVYRDRVRFEAEYRKLQRFLQEDVARERTRLIRNLDLVSAAQQVSMAIKQEVDVERILPVVLEQLEHFTRADCISVFTVDDHDRPLCRAERRRGVDQFPPDLDQDSIETSLVIEAVHNGRQVHSLNERTGEFILTVFFSTPGSERGVVRIARNVADEPDFQEELPAFEQAVGQLVRMVSLGFKTARFWDRAIRDEKTGLFNNNHYQEQIRRMAQQAQRSGAPLSLIMLDIDKFKDINDTFGHLAGDIVLAQVADIIKREAREGDTPFRYGGEELCIICSGTTEADAALAAERLRHLIACTEFRDDRGRLLPISASFGVAEFDGGSMESELVLKELCDRALYVAKENGRNRVVVARGGEDFEVLERAGQLEREVKYRLGIQGDNTPLSDAARPTPSVAHEQVPAVSKRLNGSLEALAVSLSEVVGDDSARARVVDCVVRETTDFLTRNLSARLAEQASEPEPKPKPARRKAARKKAEPDTEPATGTKAETKAETKTETKPEAKAAKKPAAARKPRAAARKSPARKAAKARDTATEAEKEELATRT